MRQEIRRVVYLAAHGGFAGQAVPLGGGAAIANLLAAEWRRTRPFELIGVTPAILGGGAPTAGEIVRWNEREYARFCVEFSRAATDEALRHDPRETAILVNDISEGPDFARLAGAGFRVVTIYHVDVVAYIADIYLRGWVSAPALTRAWGRLRPVMGPVAPRILRLIFEQQRASLRHSTAVVTPSTRMKETLMAGGAGRQGARIEVVPWGAAPCEADPGGRERIRAEFGIAPEAPVALCLSRLSPEKGHDWLLEGLAVAGRAGRLPSDLHLFICGEAAFMQGESYAERLRRLAGRLGPVRVHFPGYVMGERKRDFYQAADVYVFPSRHESYGLTLAEALAAGLPAVAVDHAGASEVLRPECGVLVPREAGAELRLRLAEAVVDLLQDPARRTAMGTAGRAWAAVHPFADAAERLARLLQAGEATRD